MRLKNKESFRVLVLKYRSGEITTREQLIATKEWEFYCQENEIETEDDKDKWSYNTFLTMTVSCDLKYKSRKKYPKNL
jgi:hypothetical protein